MISQALVPAAAGEDNPQILFPTLPDFVWSLIVIIVALVLMGKFVVPKYLAILDERNAKIAQGVELSQKAEQTLADATKEAEAQIAQARQEAARIRAEAHESAKKTVAAARADAEVEAQRVADSAQRHIEAQRQAAEITLKTDVGLLASELAEKIVGEQLRDHDLSARVIDRFLDSLDVTSTQKG